RRLERVADLDRVRGDLQHVDVWRRAASSGRDRPERVANVAAEAGVVAGEPGDRPVLEIMARIGREVVLEGRRVEHAGHRALGHAGEDGGPGDPAVTD